MSPRAAGSRKNDSRGNGRVSGEPGDIEQLLAYLKDSRGFDFSVYKRTTLGRRVESRLNRLGFKSYEDYVDYLEVHPDEFTQLFNAILINTTSFFRDTQSWDILKDDIAPKLVADKEPGAPIRVWSAACASGQEAYSLAMVFAEILGEDAFRDRVKIYATDVDDDALAHARSATYDARQVKSVPPELLGKYFEPAGTSFVFKKALRRTVIFGLHDLLQDAPISRIDLLACRNTLMYFHSDAQRRIVDRLHYALNRGGILFLGKAETIATDSAFSPIDLKNRFFVKEPRPLRHERSSWIGPAITVPNLAPDNLVKTLLSAYESDPSARIVVDAEGDLALINLRARTMFGLSVEDVGRPIQDMEISYRPIELRARIDEALNTHTVRDIQDVDWTPVNGEPRRLHIQFIPLLGVLNGQRLPMGVMIAFNDMTARWRLERDYAKSKGDLDQAYEELQSTNEELETTNEELQSTVEELETTNEELQSTNEELETMNEELQSTNEELGSVNQQLSNQNEEATRNAGFLQALVRGLPAGLIVLDPDLRITLWNAKSEDLWGAAAGEVRGKHLLNLDIGLPVDSLRQPLRTVLVGEKAVVELSVPATNRRGRSIQCRLLCSVLQNDGERPVGAMIVVEEE